MKNKIKMKKKIQKKIPEIWISNKKNINYKIFYLIWNNNIK